MPELKIVAMGGLGNVTQNMFVYEYEDEMLIVDCGIGFPDNYMPGVDILIPDISYVLSRLEQGKKIVGMILTHGHDDHIAALPYVLPDLPVFPIYASPLTASFAENRMKDGGIEAQVVQSLAKWKRKALKDEDCDNINTIEFDVPTDKPGLLAFLNEYVTGELSVQQTAELLHRLGMNPQIQSDTYLINHR